MRKGSWRDRRASRREVEFWCCERKSRRHRGRRGGCRCYQDGRCWNRVVACLRRFHRGAHRRWCYGRSHHRAAVPIALTAVTSIGRFHARRGRQPVRRVGETGRHVALRVAALDVLEYHVAVPRGHVSSPARRKTDDLDSSREPSRRLLFVRAGTLRSAAARPTKGAPERAADATAAVPQLQVHLDGSLDIVLGALEVKLRGTRGGRARLSPTSQSRPGGANGLALASS